MSSASAPFCTNLPGFLSIDQVIPYVRRVLGRSRLRPVLGALRGGAIFHPNPLMRPLTRDKILYTDGLGYLLDPVVRQSLEDALAEISKASVAAAYSEFDFAIVPQEDPPSAISIPRCQQLGIPVISDAPGLNNSTWEVPPSLREYQASIDDVEAGYYATIELGWALAGYLEIAAMRAREFGPVGVTWAFPEYPKGPLSAFTPVSHTVTTPAVGLTGPSLAEPLLLRPDKRRASHVSNQAEGHENNPPGPSKRPRIDTDTDMLPSPERTPDKQSRLRENSPQRSPSASDVPPTSPNDDDGHIPSQHRRR